MYLKVNLKLLSVFEDSGMAVLGAFKLLLYSPPLLGDGRALDSLRLKDIPISHDANSL